jgi:DNA-binding response OmpR family regulator
VLAQAGYAVSPATSTTRAFELLNKLQFDLVILGSIPTAERRLLFLEIDRKWGTPVLLVDSEEVDPMIRARAHISNSASPFELVSAVAGLVPGKKFGVPRKTNETS